MSDTAASLGLVRRCPAVTNSSSLFYAEILEQSVGARKRVWIGLSYRPARLRRLAESIPWNLFHGLLKSLKIPSLVCIQGKVSFMPVPVCRDPVLGSKMLIFMKTSPKCLFSFESVLRDAGIG